MVTWIFFPLGNGDTGILKPGSNCPPWIWYDCIEQTDSTVFWISMYVSPFLNLNWMFSCPLLRISSQRYFLTFVGYSNYIILIGWHSSVRSSFGSPILLFLSLSWYTILSLYSVFASSLDMTWLLLTLAFVNLNLSAQTPSCEVSWF